MASLPQVSSVVILFSVVAAIAFFWRFYKDKEWTKLSFKDFPSGLIVMASVLVPFAAVFLAGQIQKVDISFAQSLPAFCGGLVATFLLSQIKLAPFLRSILLLAMAFGLTSLLPQDTSATIHMMAALSGMLVWKLAENLLGRSESTLEDVLPAAIWLSGTYWCRVGPSMDFSKYSSFLLGTLSIGLLVRILQTPFVNNDKWLYKRIMLAIFGGICVLMVGTKLLLNMSFQDLSGLAGAGMLAAYLMRRPENAQQAAEPVTASSALKDLLLIGVMTVAATRLFGTYGLLVLAASTIVVPTTGVAQIAGGFWLAKAIAQSFITQYNPNVTGVNVTHPYVGAALYAGFLAVLAVSLVLRDVSERRMLTLLTLAGCAILPPAASYFLHSEPTSSMLVSAGVAGVIVATFAPVIYQKSVAAQENVILLPLLAGAFAILTNELIDKGLLCHSQTRMQVLIGIAVFVSILLGVGSYFFNKKPQAPAAPEPPAAPAETA